MKHGPSGTVTFLFTDIEGSVRLWDAHPELMGEVLARHEELVTGAVEAAGGHVFKLIGDACCAAFARPTDALLAAIEAQRGLRREHWGEVRLRVRMALHTGEAEERGGDYYGPPLNRCTRILTAGHGGQVIVSQSTAALLRQNLPEGVELLPLGAHRLRDLTEAEELCQLVHPDLESEFPPLRSLAAFAHNLPLQVSSFIGREQEMVEVRRLLGTARLLTLTGPGGSGKTRLALQVAVELIDEYPDGVWVLQLASLADPALIPQAALGALGLRADPPHPPLDTLVDSLRPKHLLLILDNCEHLVEAAAQLAEDLLHACPRVQVLATSRETLRAEGETVWAVPPLGLPARTADRWPALERLTQYEAVRLFIERAVAADGTFRVTNANAPAVAEICHRLDGIPLAIELAASRVNVLTAEQIEARLGDRFRLLAGGRRTGARRQQTLRAAIDWSYDLLPAAEQRLFARLSVFAGSFPIEAAEAVCTVDEAEVAELAELLGSLVGKSLVVREEADGARRLRLLESLRAYAADRLGDGGGAEGLRRSHAEFYLALGAEVWPHCEGPEHSVWLDRLERENNEFRAALAWAEGADPVLGLRLANKLLPLWEMRGHWSEGRDWYLRLLQRVEGEETDVLPGALGNAGLLARMLGELQEARALFERSLALCRQSGDEMTAVRALNSLGVVAWQENDLALARTHLTEALTILREANDLRQQMAVLNNLGLAAQAQGDYDAARGYYEESVAVGRRQDDRYALPTALLNLGVVAMLQGDYVTARQHYEECLALRRAAEEAPFVAVCLNCLGALALEQGEYETARGQLEEALAIARDVGDRTVTAFALNNLGSVEFELGNHAAARPLYEESLALHREVGSPHHEANCYEQLGRLALAEGDQRTAQDLCERSLQQARQIESQPVELLALHAVGRTAAAHGEPELARKHFRACLTLARELNARGMMAWMVRQAAWSATVAHRAARAVRLHAAADRLRRDMGTPLAPREVPEYEAELARLRQALGEAAFKAAWAGGVALDLPAAVDEAEAELASTEGSPATD